MKDLYKTLGVAEGAEESAIKKAYRKLAKEYHPDVTGDDKKKTERFKEINEAYAVLGDGQKRKEYDRLKHARCAPTACPKASMPKRSRARSAVARPRAASSSAATSTSADIFSSLFGGAGRRRTRHPVAGPGAPAPKPWRGRDRPAAGYLRRGRPGHQADDSDRQRSDR